MNLNLKHVLVDTCFLIHFQKYSEGGFFDELLNTFETNKCNLAINELIRQEFVRSASSQGHYRERNDLIDKLVAYKLPIQPEIWEDAVLISQISNFISKPINGITDTIIMAQLKKWEGKLVLLTTDIFDFQKPFIDRSNLMAIDVKSEVITVGVHEFNNVEFLKLKKRFDAYRPKI